MGFLGLDGRWPAAHCVHEGNCLLDPQATPGRHKPEATRCLHPVWLWHHNTTGMVPVV